MYSQEKTFSSLAKVLSNYDRVIIDTCALMDEGFPLFMDALVGSKRYWKDGLEVITLKECIEELEKHAANKDWHYSEARIDAVRALNILKDAQRRHHVIQVAKRQQRKGDTFADPSILATATVLRIHYRVLVITQDKNLAYDLDKLNSLGSQNGRFLAVMKINAGGQLEGHSLNKPKEFKKIEAKKEKAPALKVEKKEIKKIEVKPVSVPKIEQKPAKVNLPKKEEKPVEPKQNKPFYDFGSTPVDAVIASAKRLNVLVRDDASIPYVKGIHGPVDVTKDVLRSKLPVSALAKTGDTLTVNVKGLKMVVEKTERDFKATTSLEPLPQKQETAPVQKAKPQIKETEKEVKQPENKPVSKPIETKAKETEKKSVSEKKEKPVVKAEAKPEAKPEVKPTKKVEVKKAEEKNPVAKKSTSKKVEAKPAPKKAEEKKPAAPKKTPLEKTQALEKRLSANVSNPNYPKEKKSKDIDSFFKLYDKLSEDEKKQIKLDVEFLKQQREIL